MARGHDLYAQRLLSNPQAWENCKMTKEQLEEKVKFYKELLAIQTDKLEGLQKDCTRI